MNCVDRRTGLSVTEVMIVAALSSAILLSAMLVMSRTGRTFQKGTDLMNTQVLLDSIVSQLKDDLRRMRALVPGPGSCDDHNLTFQAWLRDPSTGELRLSKVAYAFDPQARTLTRRVDGNATTQRDFHGPGKVTQVLFRPEKSWADFRYLTVAIQVNAERLATDREHERADAVGSRLAIVTQFHPKSQEPLSSFASVP